MAVVAVGIDLEERGPQDSWARSIGDLGLGADLVDVLAVDHVPLHGIALGAVGEAILERRGALEAGAHRVSVVLDDVDDRQAQERGQVQRLVERTLVHRAVAEIAEAAALDALVFECEGDAERPRESGRRRCRDRPSNSLSGAKKCIEPPLPFEQPVALPKSSAMHSFIDMPTARAWP